jgi:hypothetical protein
MNDKPRIERLPIKLIMPKQGKERKIPAGGSKPVPFRPVTQAFRVNLLNEVKAIGEGMFFQIMEVDVTPSTCQTINEGHR